MRSLRWISMISFAAVAASCNGGTHMTGDGAVEDHGTTTPEVCNGRDDDGDGSCDEGYACCAGATLPCATVCGTSGWTRCTADCTVATDELCRPPAEACNGIDDDCDGLTDEAPECAGRWLWLNPQPTWNSLQAVLPAADGTAIVVGAGGSISRWDGTAWTAMYSPTTQDLRGIAGVPGGPVFAVGLAGTILRLDGDTWTSVPSPVGVNLHAVWLQDAFFGVAVGDQGTVLIWDGTNWTADAAGTPEDLFGVWGSSSTDVFAVGGHRVLAHWNGIAWDVQQPYTDEGWMEGVWGSGPHDVYAVGRGGWVLHYDGTAWWKIPAGTDDNLWDVWGSGPNDVFIAGERGTDAGARPPMLHYDGAAWSAMTTAGGAADLFALGGTGPANVWVVGENGTVERYQGSGWAMLEHGPEAQLNAIRSLPGGGMLAVGQRQDASLSLWTSVLWSGAAGWRADLWSDRGSLEDAWVVADDDIWTVGPAGAIFRGDGTAWTRASAPTTAGLHAIWGASPTALWAVGESGTVLRWDGAAWAAEPVAPETDGALHGVRGLGPDDVWAVGDGGTVLHRDASSWTAGNAGANVDLRAVAPISATLVIAVGAQPMSSGTSSGVVLRWDGARWARDDGWFPKALLDVAAVSADDVYAVDGATVWHSDGHHWTALAATGLGLAFYYDVFRAVTVDPALGLVTAGGRGAILRWVPTPP